MAQEGDVFHIDNQCYQCVGFFERRTSDGRNLDCSVWRAKCADCPAEFDQYFPAWFPYRSRVSINRRCNKCKKPGVRVNKDPNLRRKFYRVQKGPKPGLNISHKRQEETRTAAMHAVAAVLRRYGELKTKEIPPRLCTFDQEGRVPANVALVLPMNPFDPKTSPRLRYLLREMQARGMVRPTGVSLGRGWIATAQQEQD